jgi:citrate synthase
MHMLSKIGSLDKVDAFVRDSLANKKKIMGFGHRVYKTRDPRAIFLKNFAKKLAEQTGNSDLYEMSRKIEDIMEKEVGARGIYPNVDFYSATTYHCIGLQLDLFTPMFAVSRIGGWVGHLLEQQDGNRLIRPKADYVGPHDVAYVPMAQR